MPAGEEISKAQVTIDTILRLQKQFDVSMEAISIRLAKVTLESCTIVAAARIADDESMRAYRIDYAIPSRTSTITLPQGLEIENTVFSQCTAIGYTTKGRERVTSKLPELYLECVGIPPYPGTGALVLPVLLETNTHQFKKISESGLQRIQIISP